MFLDQMRCTFLRFFKLRVHLGVSSQLDMSGKPPMEDAQEGSKILDLNQSTIFRQRTMVSDLEVLTLILAASHSVANPPMYTEYHGQIKPTEPLHLSKAETKF